ncbi:MAG: lipopolysaccharide biosynthesis protein [Alphaproteobacteria bacterium]
MPPNDDGIVHSARSIGHHMVRGAAWMVAMRWCIRGLGLISTVILARLLTPLDFGIVAMAMVFVGLLEILLSTGVDQAVIRLQQPTRQDYDSAWTLQLLVGIALGLAIFLAAPAVAAFFARPELELAIQVLSLRAVGLGAVNIGVVEFRRQLDFAKEFRFSVARKVISFAVTLVAAAFLRNYWALIIGMVLAPWLVVALSYAMQPYRPRLSLRRIVDLWRFTRWLLLANLSDFLRRQFDQFVVGRVAGVTPLANYYMANDIAVLPTVEVVWSTARALLPGYAKLASQPVEIARAYVDTLRMMALLAVPLGTGIAVTADDIVAVLLGDQWTAVGPLMHWLGLAGALMGLSGALQPFFVALGHVRLYALIIVAEIVVYMPVAVLAVWYGGVEEMAIARVGVLGASLPCFLWLSTRIAPLRSIEVFGALARPLLASAVMYGAVFWLNQALQDEPAMVRLPLAVVWGIAVYAATDLLLWQLAGRPDGAERTVATRLRPKHRPST